MEQANCLQALNPGKTFAHAGEQILVPNVITMPPGKAASVVVSKSDSSVTAYDTNGKLLAYWGQESAGGEARPLIRIRC